MKKKIIKTGNSAAVTIPHEFMESLNLRIGDEVKALPDYQKGMITFRFSTMRQLRLSAPKKATKK